MSFPNFKLKNSKEIPSIGLGTWQSAPGQVQAAVKSALKAGYRHIDTAWAYGNETEIGQAIKESGIPREEIFITTKLWSTYHNRVEEGFQSSLDRLGVDYVDLYLIHWPVALNDKGNSPFVPRKPDGTRDILHEIDACVQTWKAVESLYKSGRAKSIGVSNWSIPNLEKVLENCEIQPMVNQVELHPYLPQHELVEFCHSKGIVVEAYSPLGSTNSPLQTDPLLISIASKHSCSVSNVLINFQVNRNVVVLPKSVTPSRIEENFKFVKLDEEDMEKLSKLHEEEGKARRFVKPDWGVPFGFKDW